jgi:hypothetical protein
VWLAQPAGAALWRAERAWSEAEEARFAEWVETQVGEDLFLRPDIPHDCADLPYGLRWIYARERRLPVAATPVEGPLFGHWSPQFGPVSKGPWKRDANFLAALRFLFGTTGTKTIPADTYPVALDREHLRAGVLYHAEHHASVIARVALDGSEPHPLVTWESTLPPAVRRLRPGVFSGSAPEWEGHGLRRFRWVEWNGRSWAYVPLERQPGTSREQFELAFVAGKLSFAAAVAERLDPLPAPPMRQALRFVAQAERLARERVAIVQTGASACGRAPARCGEGSDLWELHSTPNRDARMLGYLARVRALVEGGQVEREWVREVMRVHTIQITPARRMSLLDLYENARYVSSEPADTVEKRWGLAACDSLDDRASALEQSIAFLRQQLPPVAAGTLGTSGAPGDGDGYVGRAIEHRERELAALAKERLTRGCGPGPPLADGLPALSAPGS